MIKRKDPKVIKNTNVTIRMAEADMQKLQEIVECTKLSKGNVIRELIHKSKPCVELNKD
tara:strand:+ start:1632 stop:1808 length:177 start_codon:yes stop_codon:yes gene_type:complete